MQEQPGEDSSYEIQYTAVIESSALSNREETNSVSVNWSDVTVVDETSAFSDLTQEAIGRVRLTMARVAHSQPSEELVRIDAIDIRYAEMKRLFPGGSGTDVWMNDNIVNSYLHLLLLRNERLTAGDIIFHHIHAFYSTFCTKLYMDRNVFDYKAVQRWTKRRSDRYLGLDEFSLDLLLIPINHTMSHWSLVIVLFKEKKILFYDSMLAGRCPHNIIMQHLMRWLRCEHEDKKKTALDDSGWECIVVGHGAPQQRNDDDCGVFVCKYADFILRGAKMNFTAAHMDYFRARMAHELLVKRVA